MVSLWFLHSTFLHIRCWEFPDTEYSMWSLLSLTSYCLQLLWELSHSSLWGLILCNLLILVFTSISGSVWEVVCIREFWSDLTQHVYCFFCHLVYSFATLNSHVSCDLHVIYFSWFLSSVSMSYISLSIRLFSMLSSIGCIEPIELVYITHCLSLL